MGLLQHLGRRCALFLVTLFGRHGDVGVVAGAVVVLEGMEAFGIDTGSAVVGHVARRGGECAVEGGGAAAVVRARGACRRTVGRPHCCLFFCLYLCSCCCCCCCCFVVLLICCWCYLSVNHDKSRWLAGSSLVIWGVNTHTNVGIKRRLNLN